MFAWNNLYSKIILAAAIVLLFAPPVHFDSLWWREAINCGHTVLFIFLAFIIYSQLKVITPDSGVLIKYFYVLVIGFLLGVAIEILQIVVNREPSLGDLYRNFFGIMAGLCLHAYYMLKNIYHKKRVALVSLLGSIGFLLAGLSPLVLLSWHYMERINAFPVVIDFDSSWAASFMHYKKGNYPGVSIIEPEPDWSGYHKLKLNLQSDNNRDIDLVLRVHDKVHNQEYSDRFNMKLTVRPGFDEFQIPLNAIRYGPVERELDLKNVAGIILYSSKREEWAKITISNISLE